MLTSRFFRRLFIPYLLLICAATGIVGGYAAMRMTTAYLDNTRDSLNNEATLVGQMLQPDLTGRAEQLQALVQQLGQSLSCRVTIVDSDGIVLADSEADPAH